MAQHAHQLNLCWKTDGKSVCRVSSHISSQKAEISGRGQDCSFCNHSFFLKSYQEVTLELRRCQVGTTVGSCEKDIITTDDLRTSY